MRVPFLQCPTLWACEIPPTIPPGAPTPTPALSCGSLCAGIGDSRCPSSCPCNFTAGNFYCNPSAPTFAPPVPTINIHCTVDSDPKGGVDTAIGCIPTGDAATFIKWLLGRAILMAGGIAFLLMIVGALMVIVSSGNPDRVKAGSQLITSAISGLIFIIFSLFLLKLIGVEFLSIPGL